MTGRTWWTPARWGLLLLAGTVLHGVLAVSLPISGDEAYYWDCSRHPSWSYFDQPPLAIWMITPFRAVLGDVRLAVRAPAILASLLIGLFLLPLIRRLGGGVREAAIAYLVLHATPLFFIGSFYNSTDIQMIAAFVGATWAAVALGQGERRAWWGLAIATGLGFLAKLPMVLFAPVIVPLLLQRDVRAHLRGPTPYLAGALWVAITSPVWVWSLAHSSDDLAFQFSRLPRDAPFTLQYLLDFIGANLVLFTPFIAVALAVAWVLSFRRRDAAWWTYRVASIGPLLFFSLVALRGRVAAHWGAPTMVLAVVALVLFDFRGRKLLVVAGAVTGLALSALVIGIVSNPVAAIELTRPAGDDGTTSSNSRLGALVGNREIAREAARRLRPGELVASESYTMVHGLAFLEGGELPTRLAHIDGGRHGLASLYWHRPAELEGRDFLVVTVRHHIVEPLRELCQEVREEEPQIIEAGERPIRTVYYFRCLNLLDAGGTFTRLPDSPDR